MDRATKYWMNKLFYVGWIYVGLMLFCAGGLRSALATKSLKDMGYKNVSHIDGGFSSMKNNGFKVV